MKKLLFICLLIYSVTSTVNAQIKLDWATGSGGATGNDDATSVAYDASGNVYTAGYFRGTVDFDPSAGIFTLTSNGGVDAFIQKLDVNGNFLAAYNIGGTLDDAINAITIDATGNIYVAGYFRNTMDVDLGAGNSPLTTSTVQSCFVVKYTSALTLTWAKAFNGASAQYISSLNVDGNGNVYTAGTVGSGTIDFDPNVGVNNFIVANLTSALFLHKLSSTGNLVWAKGLNSDKTGNASNSIDFDSNQNPVFVGAFSGSIDFDAGAGTNILSATGTTHTNGFVCKYDAAGNHLFAFQIGSFSAGGLFDDDAIKKVEIDNSNNIYITGLFTTTTDFDPSASSVNYTTNGGQSSDAFVAKYSNTGSFLWVNVALSNVTSFDEGKGLSITASGDVFVSSNNNSLSPVITIHKLNSAGVLSFSKTLATKAFCNDIKYTGIALLVAGNYNTTSDFDPSYFAFNLIASGSDDAFVAKYSECTTSFSSSSLTGATALCNGSTNTYSVSPVSGALGYFWSNTIGMVGTSTTNVISLLSGQTATTGVVSLTAYNYCSNAPTQTLQVIVTPNTTVNVSPSTPTVCNGSSIILTASGATTYSWSSGETTASIVKNPTSTTTYTVIGFNGNCSSSKVITTTVQALPNVLVSINQATAACAGSPAILTASGATSYTWNTGALTNTISVTPSVTTVYTVTGVNASGCVKTTTQTVTILTPVLTVSASAYSVCPGGYSLLSVSGAQSYTWNGPGGTTTGSVRGVTPTVTSTFVVGGTGITGCMSSTNIVVYVTAGITVSATASSSISCSGAPVEITASGATSYTWNTGATSSTISVSPLTPTIYTVTGTSGSCSGTKTISIGVATSPNVNAATTTPTICAGMSANLVASVSPFVPTMSYTWSTSQTTSNIVVTPTVTTTYTVTGRNFTNGCTDDAVITVTLSTCTGVFESIIEANKISTYPNPNNGEFTIATIKGTYHIVNTIGAVVKTIEVKNNEELIDVSDLSQGIYYIIGKTAKAKIIITK